MQKWNIFMHIQAQPKALKFFNNHTMQVRYSRVHISSDEVFFNILKKPSIVQD